jgi:hypothetical protein
MKRRDEVKIKNLPKDKQLNGIKIKHGKKLMCIAHAWPVGINDEEIGMFLMDPENYKTQNGKLHPVFMTRTKFMNLEVIE